MEHFLHIMWDMVKFRNAANKPIYSHALKLPNAPTGETNIHVEGTAVVDLILLYETEAKQT